MLRAHRFDEAVPSRFLVATVIVAAIAAAAAAIAAAAAALAAAAAVARQDLRHDNALDIAEDAEDGYDGRFVDRRPEVGHVEVTRG